MAARGSHNPPDNLPSWNMNQVMGAMLAVIGVAGSIIGTYITLTNQITTIKLQIEQAKDERADIRNKIDNLNVRGTESAAAKFAAIELKLLALDTYNIEDTKNKAAFVEKMREIQDSTTKASKEAAAKFEFDVAQTKSDIRDMKTKFDQISSTVDDLYAGQMKLMNSDAPKK